MMHRTLFFLFILLATSANGQTPSAYSAYKEAQLKESVIYTFDAARTVTHFDATPDGKMWFTVDKFGVLENMIVGGNRIQFDFNSIPVATCGLSPDGSYIIWMGLERSVTEDGFNNTTTHLYKSWNVGKDGTRTDLIGKYISDYNQLQFFPKYKKWVALLPAANVKQEGEHDFAIENGNIISKGFPHPKMFSYDSTGTKWAYRSTDEADENLITADGSHLLWKRASKNPNIATNDPIVMHFTPDIKLFGSIFDGRDYSFGFRNEATLFKTTYFTSHSDTARSYLIFNNKKQPLYKWINSIQLDTAGKKIVYFASDPADFTAQKKDERNGVVVENGKVIAGPYIVVGRLFLSPSGKNLAWSAAKTTTLELYHNGKMIGALGNYLEVQWSPDEKNLAFVTSTERQKYYVVCGGKRSALYDRIGRIAFTADKTALEFVAIKNTKLLKVRMSL